MSVSAFIPENLCANPPYKKKNTSDRKYDETFEMDKKTVILEAGLLKDTPPQ